MNHKKKLILLFLGFILCTSAVYAFSNYFTVSNSGTITSIGIDFTDDQQTTCTSIDWVNDVNSGHALEPLESYVFYGYLFNPATSSEDVVCTFVTNNYAGNTTDTWSLAWDYGGAPIAPNTYASCNFTLSILSTATEGESFSHDIVIEGEHSQ